MLWSLARFEFGYQWRQMVSPIVFSIFFLLTFAAVTVDQITIGSTGNVNINSPFAITQIILVMSLIGLFIPAALLANVVMRDGELRTQEMFYTLPISPRTFLLGRFIGAFLAVMMVFASVPLAIWIGSMMPWLNPDRLGPTVLSHYAYTYFVIGGINLLVTGMIFFTVANLTRSNIAVYTSLVVFLVIYFVGLGLTNDPEMVEAVAPYDPLGFLTYGLETRYWTAFERNTQLVPLEGTFLFNRLLWLGVGFLFLVFNVLTFSFRARSSRAGRRRVAEAAKQPVRFIPTRIALPKVTPVFTGATPWSQFWLRTRFEVGAVVRSVAFWVLLALGIFNSLGALLNFNLIYDVPAYPVTRVMIELLFGTFSIVPAVVAIYYASEVVWRERTYQIHEIIDSTPAPNWVFVFSKFLAMALVLFALMAVAMLTGIGAQLAKGYTQIDYGLYAFRLILVFGWPLMLTAMLSLFVQVISLNRYVGILIMVLVLVAQVSLANVGYEHNLYQFGGAPSAPMSDMNGNGHYLIGVFWFYFYWTCFSAVLMIMSYLLWMRGGNTSLLMRMRRMGSNFGPITAVALLVGIVGFIGSGAFIYYNTNVLNAYVTRDDREARSVAYEEAYRQYEDILQPAIVEISTQVDIFPDELRVEAKGNYVLENQDEEPITHVHYDFAFPLKVEAVDLAGAVLESEDRENNYYIFALETPLEPGAQSVLTFKAVWDYNGFRNSGNGTRIVGNGTFVDSGQVLPHPGFRRQKMILDRNTRRRLGKEPVDRMPKLEQSEYYDKNGFTRYSAWVPFRTTVSTKVGQTAIAPGYLKRDWQENGRHYFEYEMDTPILAFFSYLSADYQVARDVWTAKQSGHSDVNLEVYYHEPHAYNVERMLEAMKLSFDYFTEHFSPYQFRQMRILEFPDYATFAQAFPNTVPYSEGIGFIADIRDPASIDIITYVTAHEVAHQWWAHQVLPANVQGSTMIVEAFAQYSAIMVMEKLLGPDIMRRFLKYELDSYLRARGGEQLEELPLNRVENQGYIHYRKGSVAMYALKDYVGEEVVNRSLKRLIEGWAYRSTPYPTTIDYLRILREEAGPEHDELITDLFERIVLWDLKVTDAEVTEREDGRFDVAITVEAGKVEADGEGQETELPLDMSIDIGLFTVHPDDVNEGDDHVIQVEKQRIKTGEQTITVTVDERPTVVGIDPYVKLIDRNSGDNLKRL